MTGGNGETRIFSVPHGVTSFIYDDYFGNMFIKDRRLPAPDSSLLNQPGTDDEGNGTCSGASYKADIREGAGRKEINLRKSVGEALVTVKKGNLVSTLHRWRKPRNITASISALSL